MRASTASSDHPVTGPLLVVAGLVLGGLAWFVPVNLRSFSPALLHAAGTGTPSVAAFGGEWVDEEKSGPAMLALEAARAVHDPGAARLDAAWRALAASQPELVAWGGWDPLLAPIVRLNRSEAPDQSTPVLTFFTTDESRDPVRAVLADSRSMAVRTLLKTRDIEITGKFVPAKQPGGQPLDAVILLSALLYQGEHFSPALQRAVRTLADTAVANRALGDLEPFFIDLLSLGQRLDWIQLCELLQHTNSVAGVADFAQLIRTTPDRLPMIYTAAMMADSTDEVARYLIRYGQTGRDDLRLALANGQGAVRQLVKRQVPVNHSPVPASRPVAALGLLHPWLMIGIKYLAYLLGAFLIFRGLDCWLILPEALSGLPRMRSGVLAVLFAGLVILATEPFLLTAVPRTGYHVNVTLPLLANSVRPTHLSASPHHAMNTSTIVSIGIFALLQICTYIVCLLKLNEISRQPLSPQLKLRLTENEDNLFDSGLYIGMMGTAAALVLQVLGVIDPNLLAAYSSNLFGLVCVAFVKIRHVRGFKRKLILEAQASVLAPAES